MSEVELGAMNTTTRELLRSARADGPSAAARTQIWSSVSAGVVTGAAAAGVSGAGTAASAKLAATGASGATKIGTLFGGVMTVGLATVLITVGALPTLRPTEPVAADFGPPIATTENEDGPSPLTTELATLRAQELARRPGASGTSGTLGGYAASPGTAEPEAAMKPADDHGGSTHRGRPLEDPLLRESALVAEARGALVRGEPASALATLEATHALTPRSLEPEELSLEARALRALGLESEAIEREMQLKTRYPEHALAR